MIGSITPVKTFIAANVVPVKNDPQNQEIRELLIKAKNGDKEASQNLYDQFKDFISYIAKTTCYRNSKWLSFDELTSEGEYGIVKAIQKFNPEVHHSPFNFVRSCISNAIKDYIKCNFSVHTPFSAVCIDRNRSSFSIRGSLVRNRGSLVRNKSSFSPEELALDPDSENLNKDIPSLEREHMEKLIEFLKNDAVKNVLSDHRKRTILELSYGIDLGSNPDRKILPCKEIADILEINVGSVYMTKTRTIRELKRLAKQIAA